MKPFLSILVALFLFRAIAVGAASPPTQSPARPFWWSSISPIEKPVPTLSPLAPPYFEDNEPPVVAPSKLDQAWQRWVEQEAARWKRLKEKMLKTWDVYYPPSQTVWVDYSEGGDAVGNVDFENGTALIEVVVAASEANPVATARHLIAKKAQAMIERRGSDGVSVLRELFSPETMNKIDAAQLHLADDAISFTGGDGIKRYRFRTQLPLKQNHIVQRWERYRGAILEQSLRHGVDPALVAAVIHTESAFNPFARSPIPALGLMQIVPSAAGRETYAALYGVDTTPSTEYFYHPKQNIELGVAYLSRLSRIYFREVADPVKRRLMIICAYNWGPGALRRKVTPRQANQMTVDQLYQTLQQRVPTETKNYLRLVEQRRLLYEGL
jgi:membrane-bound lytic murein transglycosylase C